jgi:hypothetical protein
MESDDDCPCGLPLHYQDPKIEAFMRKLVARLGPTIVLTARGRSFEVSRHYIALHGIKAAELAVLGFPEVFHRS